MAQTNAAELQLIAHDGWQLRTLALKLRSVEGGSILSYLLLPTFAFYSVEVSDWLERAGRSGGGQLLREYNSAFRSVRARLKVFDDKSLGLQGLQALMDRCDQESVDYFNKKHAGLLGPMKRWLQDDLGLYFVGPDLVLTTHIGLATTSSFPTDSGFPRDTASGGAAAPPEYSVRIGRVLGAITDALPQLQIPDATENTCVPEGSGVAPSNRTVCLG